MARRATTQLHVPTVRGPRNKHPLLRFIWFDKQLRAERFPTARSLARAFEITERTAYRDVEYLREQMHLPIGYDPRRRGYYYTEPNVPVPPTIALTAGDLVAIYLAQRILEQYEGTQFGARLAYAFEKISTLLSDDVTIDLDTLRDGFSFHVGPPGRLEVATFETVSRALTERRPLLMEYVTQSRGEVTRRLIDPYHLHHYGGAWYLIAYCHRTHAVKTFNVSRIERTSIQSRTFERVADFNLKTYLQDGFSMMRGTAVEEVVIRFDAYQARWIAERTWHSTEKRHRHADGSLTLRFRLSGLDGVKRWVMSYGEHAEVLEPESLRREVAEAHAQAARLNGWEGKP